jgi:ABC-2 type transport system ATP-binding protein
VKETAVPIVLHTGRDSRSHFRVTPPRRQKHMDATIRLTGINKSFGKTQAVENLSLEVPRGGLYGFIGPNGAGKTTAIRMIMSILFPDSGELSVLGYASSLAAKDRIGYLPEERGVYRKMRVGAFLRFMARLKGVRGYTDHQAREALERVGLDDVLRKKCEELSKGMLQKVQFLACVAHKPDLLILDEPFSGLDPLSTRRLRELILEEHARGATILFSTHVMPQAEEICRHIVMIHQGRKVLDASMPEIRSQYDPRTILFDTLSKGADVSTLDGIPGVEAIARIDEGYEARLREGTDPSYAMRAIMDRTGVARIELARPRLEDVFIRLVTGDSATCTDAAQLRASLVAGRATA